jgi:hypothetical protein
MAHFAKINEQGIVENVLVVPNSEEHRGQDYLNGLGFTGRWIQASYSGKIRKHFPSMGYSYSEELDAFIPPKRHSSWILDESSLTWHPPFAPPNDGENYEWDEGAASWVIVVDKIEQEPQLSIE